MLHSSRLACAALSLSLLLAREAVAQGARSGTDASLATVAWADTGAARARAARALPPSALTGRTTVLSEVALGEYAGPYFLTLSGGSVYRLELLKEGGAGGPLDDAAASNAHWLLDAEATPWEGITVTPRIKSWPPVQILLPLDAGVRSVGGLDLLLRPARSGEYRIDATSARGATLLIRVVRQDADEVEHACVRERDAGNPLAACAELHAARRSLNPLGILTRPLAILLFVAAGALLGH
jgi:hypothetical protein